MTSGNAASSMLDGVLILGMGSAFGSLGSVESASRMRGAGAGGPTLDDVGGEWECEGLGRGLEERLEAMVTAGGEKA